jgi:hypothetical protein
VHHIEERRKKNIDKHIGTITLFSFFWEFQNEKRLWAINQNTK